MAGFTSRSMSDLGPLIAAWDEAHREMGIALENIPAEDVWKRAHPRLLSVGEIVGHVAFWQAVSTLGGGSPEPDPSALPIQSPLISQAFRYYTQNVDQPVHLALDGQQLAQELAKIHAAAKRALATTNLEDPHPNWGTWGGLLQYQVFHVAYHTGQVYSVRHILGHETEDN